STFKLGDSCACIDAVGPQGSPALRNDLAVVLGDKKILLGERIVAVVAPQHDYTATRMDCSGNFDHLQLFHDLHVISIFASGAGSGVPACPSITSPSLG